MIGPDGGAARKPEHGMVVKQRSKRQTTLFRNVVRACRHRLRAGKVVDSSGAELTGRMLLARALGLRRLLRRHVLRPDERHVGVLLPPSVAAVVVNLALTLDRRVTVNLNYTLTSELINSCLAQAGVRRVLTSRRFMERVPLRLEADLVYLEDLRDKPTPIDKLAAALPAYVFPSRLLLRRLGLERVAADETMTVIFTSGTSGQPKGVELAYGNIASNAEAIRQVIDLRPSDVVIGVLPFFHSFGYTVTLWTVLMVNVKAAYHVNPLEGQAVCKLCRKQKGTILTATPLFLRTYLRRCSKEDFATLEVIAAGGERLPRELSDAFEQKFGIRPIEAYGTTETSPVVAANLPPRRARGDPDRLVREGTVGRPVPGVRAKVIDLDTGADLGLGERGMLWVTGPNVMKGYLGRPDATAEAIRDGWYVTGDVAVIDEDGFIEIVGRESRFAKIGGEMVPHVTVEEALTRLIGTDEEGAPRAVVVSVPDPARGERLVVVHTAIKQTPDEIRQGLAAAGLPNLFIPSGDSFVQVDRLPVIGTGKLDLKRVKEIALTAKPGSHVSAS